MVKTILSTAVIMIGSFLIIEMTSQALVVWATRPDSTQGKLIKPQQQDHWVDRPEVGVIV